MIAERLAYRTNETFFFHDLNVDSIERFQVIDKNHIKLHWPGHIESLSKLSETCG